MVPARGIVERVERALELAGELGHLGAVWELDADGAREGARSLADRATRGEDVGPLAGTVCGWKDCFDVAGLHATGGAPWLAAAGPVTRSAGVVKRGSSSHSGCPTALVSAAHSLLVMTAAVMNPFLVS